MYYNYKIQQKKKKELLKEIEKEDGITFKPILTDNPVYYNPESRLYGNIHERNQKFLEGRRLKTEEVSRKTYNSRSPRVNTKEDYLNNIKHIEDKLYIPGKTKQIKRLNPNLISNNNYEDDKRISFINNQIEGLSNNNNNNEEVVRNISNNYNNVNVKESSINNADAIRYNFSEDLNSD